MYLPFLAGSRLSLHAGTRPDSCRSRKFLRVIRGDSGRLRLMINSERLVKTPQTTNDLKSPASVK